MKERRIVSWLAHHDPEQEDFDAHVIYIFNHAVCLGCFTQILGITVGLIVCNLISKIIFNLNNIALVIFISFIHCIPSILQYLIQIIYKKPLKKRILKVTSRFLIPMGMIFLIFNNMVLFLTIGLLMIFFIIFLRERKERILKNRH